MSEESDILVEITPHGYQYSKMCQHPFFDMDLNDDEEEVEDGNQEAV